MPEKTILITTPTEWYIYNKNLLVAVIRRTRHCDFDVEMTMGTKLFRFNSIDDAEDAVYRELGIER